MSDPYFGWEKFGTETDTSFTELICWFSISDNLNDVTANAWLSNAVDDFIVAETDTVSIMSIIVSLGISCNSGINMASKIFTLQNYWENARETTHIIISFQIVRF